MIPLFIIWGISLVVGSVGVAWSIQERRKNNMKRLLEERCTKLADHVLWMEHDRSLGGEVDMALIPSRCPESCTMDLVLPSGHILPPSPTVSKMPLDQIDMLLDALETAEVTGVKSADHKCEGVRDYRGNLGTVVTLEFGEIGIRYLVLSQNNRRPPDLIWKGHLFPELPGKQAKRLRQIFTHRMASEATKSLTEPKQKKATQQDVDEDELLG